MQPNMVVALLALGAVALLEWVLFLSLTVSGLYVLSVAWGHREAVRGAAAGARDGHAVSGSLSDRGLAVEAGQRLFGIGNLSVSRRGACLRVLH